MDPSTVDPDSSRMTSASLILGIQAGQEDAWVRMVNLFGPLVFKWVKPLSKFQFQTEDISDVSQEVFLVATQKIEKYRHSREKHGSFRGWLFGITRNVVRDYQKRNSKAPTPDDERAREVEWIPENLVEKHDYDGDIWLLEMGVTYQAVEIIKKQTESHVWQAFWRTSINGEK